MNRFKSCLVVVLLLMILARIGYAHETKSFAADTTAININVPMFNYSEPKEYILSKIRTEGATYIDDDVLIASSGLKVGDSITIPGIQISQAIKNLWKKGQFSDVKIEAEQINDQEVMLIIYIKETPRVYSWNFKGISKTQADDIKDNLQLKRGGQLSEHVISKNKELIKRYYDEKGFLNAEIDVLIENDSIIENAVNLTFDIAKNDKVKIGSVTFDGNEMFTDRQLRGALKKTKQKGINIFQSSKLKLKEYEEDMDYLIDYYNARGYRNANVVKDSIYDINSRRIGINISVEEGNKYYFRDINWVGNSIYKTDDLSNMLGINEGDLYDKKSLHKRLGIGMDANPDDMSISSLYQNDGYLMSDIKPEEIIIGQDSIDLEIKISEGNPFTINEVKISGNTRVNDEVIRREIHTNPGELYNRALLMRTIRQLSQMGHFNPEVIMPNITPVSSSLVDISWPLEEQASDKFEISGGWGAGMFIGSIGVQFNNLSLVNFGKKGSWRPYPQGQNQKLAISAQSNGSYYKQLSVSFTEPWLGGTKPNSLTVGVQYSDQSDATIFWQNTSSHFRTLGVSAGIGRRLSWPDPYFTLYNEVGYQSYILTDWPGQFVFSDGSSNIFSLRTVLGRNTVDQPIYPRRGSDFSLSLTLTPPYSLFDGKDYSDNSMADEERYKWIEYHKWIAKAQWYYPLDNVNKFVLMSKVEMGFLGSYDINKVSPFEGFDVGGDGMSGYNVFGVDIIGLRGYDNSSLTPNIYNGEYANTYHKYTVEVRYPIMLEPSSTIYGLVFAEGGNAFSSWASFDPFLIKRSLGAGIRMYLPVVGMVGVDWGYGFDKTATDDNKVSGGQFHFSIGNQF